MSGISRDYFTGFRSAGRSVVAKAETTAVCLNPPNVAPSETPQHIKKYRKSYKQQHGVTILHHGLVDAPKQPDNFVYGKRTDPSDKVGQLLQTKKEGIVELIEEIKENQYATHQKEPLAVIPTRNYKWPAETQQDGFMFGQKIPPSQFIAKEVVFPPDAKRDTEENRLRYLKSHGNYEAGEQKNRNYQWNIKVEQHRFGQEQKNKDLNQMNKVLYQEGQKNQYPQTVIIKKNQEDWKNYNDDPIGKSKNLAQVNQYVKPDTIYGVMRKGEECTAGQCIRGDANWKEVQPDFDLGKATKFGFRNTTKEGDQTRVFGVATIRNDILKKGMKSVADPQNYGDEKPAIALLFPEKFAHMGLSKEDFEKLRPKNEIKNIFEAIGIKYGVGKFEAIFSYAKRIQGTEDDLVSVQAFESAVLEMHHLE